MKRQILIVLVFCCLSLIFSKGLLAGAEDDSFRAAVEDIFATYSAANMNKDVDGWIALWDEEGIKMSPNIHSIVGKEAIREFKHRKSQSPDDLEQIIKAEDTQLAGDFGFAHGTYFVSVTPKGGGEAKTKEGKFLTIFKKQADGSWKIYRDSVSDNPASK